jgi:uncharacterized protein with HEPN domain
MPPRSVAGLLQDVLDAAEFMRIRSTGLDAELFLRNEDLKVIFERKFEVVGEALSALRRRHPELVSRIRHAEDAIDLRHVLVHGYASIDHAILWNAFERFLSELLADARSVLAGA